MVKDLSRRAGLRLAALVCLVIAGVHAPITYGDKDEDSDARLTVRREINSLSTKQIDDFRRGVALMQSRAATDPTSWTYQANIHGFPTPGSRAAAICSVTPAPDQEGWATCQHGQFFFLSWHRMYLYYFERIVRAAVREATGKENANFALPYWDYERYPALPAPLRVPADASNSLYVSERTPNCNGGLTCVSAVQASSETALSLYPFCNCPLGESCPGGTPDAPGCLPDLLPDETFGGQFTPEPRHEDLFFGELESQPHNVVHNAVGGVNGWMSYVECAARDPIFWLHHANIDRLWQVWLNRGGGRADPLAVGNWRDEVFVFFDENGARVEMTGCEVLNMATQLDYEYKGVPVKNVELCGDPPAPTASAPPLAPAVEVEVLAATGLGAVALGAELRTVTVSAPEPSRIAAVTGELRVVIEGIELVHPGAIFEVYLNLPGGIEPDPRGNHFLGHLAVFSGVHEGHSASRSFSITDQVAALRASGHWTGQIALTFVRGNPEPAREATTPETFLRFSRIAVIRR